MRINKFVIALLLLIATFSFLYFENNGVVLTRYLINNHKVPKDFMGFKIIHLSDIHSKVYRNENRRILNTIKKERPDIIVITGDLIDRRNYNEEKSLVLIDELKKVAPIYFVTGNHEAWSGKFASLEEKLIGRGVKVLRNEKDFINRGESEIEVVGIDDPAFHTRGYSESYKDYSVVEEQLSRILPDSENFSILLSHRPELFPLYADKGVDLSFTGHAHGGQVILPLVGGLVAPNQGFFPKYYRGKYEIGDCIMILNAGLGNSIVPQRIFNRPEIVSVTLGRK